MRLGCLDALASLSAALPPPQLASAFGRVASDVCPKHAAAPEPAVRRRGGAAPQPHEQMRPPLRAVWAAPGGVWVGGLRRPENLENLRI